MKDYAKKRRLRFTRRMEGDVRTVLTLLCVGVSLVSVIFFSYIMRSQDSLIAFVPKDAKAYVHYRRLPWSDYTILKKAFTIPAHLEPREAAIFSRQDKNGELVWGTLLMWDSEDAIRIDERFTLHEIASERLDQKTFLIGDLGVVRHRNQSLAYTERGRAHKAMLSISRAQAIFSSDILVGTGHRNDMLSQTFVASLREKGNALIASMQSLASIQDDMTYIGMFRTIPDQTIPDFDMPESAIISITSLGTPTFDAMQLLLSDLKDLSTSFGTPLSDMLRDTETELRLLLLSDPSTLTLLPDTNGDLQFVLHYPAIEPTILMNAVSRFMQTALPDSIRFTLPDGNRGWEFKIDPDAFTFEPVIGVNDAWVLASDTEISLMIAESRSSGSLISASIDSLKIYLQSDLRAPDTYCGQLRGKAIYFNRSPKNMFARLDIPGNPFITLGITDIYVTKTGENSLLFCGLMVDSVDNLEID